MLVMLLSIPMGLVGCAQMNYLLQSANGHLALLDAREPIAGLLEDPATPAALTAQLQRVEVIRGFAQSELALPNRGSYRHYVDLGRTHLLYSVSAAPTLSLYPRQWCYPIVGCVTYRGFFELRAANHEAARLRQAGDDVYVAPVDAYSTLGWFDDPVTSALLRGPHWYTAGVLFHELAHQQVYAASDSPFSEAYAVAVQREGERRWLARHGNAADREQYARYHSTREQFLVMVRRVREQLAALYASSVDDAEKLRQKQVLFEQLRARFVQMRWSWGGYRGFDRWFAQDLNNAKLALVATYNDLVPRFTRLLADLNGDMRAFHGRVAQLAALNSQQRREGLPD
ncbi:MAG: putative aminopeptidase [Gammaproteobacteria bacterium]|jgi:predicted aminopeptidase